MINHELMETLHLYHSGDGLLLLLSKEMVEDKREGGTLIIYRWFSGVPYSECCCFCNMGKTGTMAHLVLQCSLFNEDRER